MREEAGLVSPPGDEEAFLRDLRELAGNADLRLQMGRRGRRYAQRAFDIHAIADRFEDVFRSLAAARPLAKEHESW